MPEINFGTHGSIYYLDPAPEGKTPVLLLHGLGVTGESWSLQLPALCQAGFRPIAPDIPGFGKSKAFNQRWSIQEMAVRMAQLCFELHIKQLHLVGISMGGAIAQQMALDFPDLVHSLVLVNTFSRLWPKQISGWIYFGRRFFKFTFLGLHDQADLVASRLFPDPGQEYLRRLMVEQIMQADQKIYRKAMIALGRFNSTQRLDKITKPTLIISGNKDSTIPISNQNVLAQRIPGARQIIIPGAGHAVIVDQPESFNSALLDFLLSIA